MKVYPSMPSRDLTHSGCSWLIILGLDFIYTVLGISPSIRSKRMLVTYSSMAEHILEPQINFFVYMTLYVMVCLTYSATSTKKPFFSLVSKGKFL